MSTYPKRIAVARGGPESQNVEYIDLAMMDGNKSYKSDGRDRKSNSCCCCNFLFRCVAIVLMILGILYIVKDHENIRDKIVELSEKAREAFGKVKERLETEHKRITEDN